MVLKTAVVKLGDGFLVRDFFRNQQHSDWLRNFETKVLFNQEATEKPDVIFRRNIVRVRSSKIFKAPFTGNECIEAICTSRQRIASFETVKTYCSFLLRQYSFFKWLCENSCSCKINPVVTCFANGKIFW